MFSLFLLVLFASPLASSLAESLASPCPSLANYTRFSLESNDEWTFFSSAFVTHEHQRVASMSIILSFNSDVVLRTMDDRTIATTDVATVNCSLYTHSKLHWTSAVHYFRGGISKVLRNNYVYSKQEIYIGDSCAPASLIGYSYKQDNAITGLDFKIVTLDEEIVATSSQSPSLRQSGNIGECGSPKWLVA